MRKPNRKQAERDGFGTTNAASTSFCQNGQIQQAGNQQDTESGTALCHQDLIEFYEGFHPTATEYTFFRALREHSVRQATFWATKHVEQI